MTAPRHSIDESAFVPMTPSAMTGVTDDLTPEVLAIIAAAVVATYGRRARIAGVKPSAPVVPAGEIQLQQWSMEGRRQIYSSHKIR